MTEPEPVREGQQVPGQPYDFGLPDEVVKSGRFTVSMDVGMGFDGGTDDDQEYGFDREGTLEDAFNKLMVELRSETPHSIQRDYGLEWGTLTVSIYDAKTKKTKTTQLGWNGSWIDHG